MRSTAGAARETRAAQSAAAEMPPTAAVPATRTAGGCSGHGRVHCEREGRLVGWYDFEVRGCLF